MGLGGSKGPLTLPCPPPAMVELDGDDIRISSRGKVAERDIVQVRPPCRDWGPPGMGVAQRGVLGTPNLPQRTWGAGTGPGMEGR